MIIWLASYPKSGNTWVRSIINQLIRNDIKKDENVFDGLLNIRRYPTPSDMLELPKIPNSFTELQKKEVIDYTIRNWKKSQDLINKKKEIQILKTHNMLCKLKVNNEDHMFTDTINSIGAIHVVRDPRNIVSSVKNHFNHKNIKESIEMVKHEYTWTGFKNNEVPQLLSSWNNHYNSWKRFPKNYLLIKYEDLLHNTKSEVKKLITFLSPFFKINTSENEIDIIVKNTSFKNFQNLERKGKFKENSFDKRGDQNTFFYLGPENNWQKFLKKKDSDLLISSFKHEMMELGYL
tara:strand:+ start:213 stop:1085 length:873 start_codon:yes stop_codon:yes gene_type:complete